MGRNGSIPIRGKCAEGGVQDQVLCPSTPHRHSISRVKGSGSSKGRTDQRPHPRTPGEKSHRSSSTSVQQRLLQSIVHGPKSRYKQVETYHRPENAQPVCSDSTLQDGDNHDHLEESTSRQLLLLCGSDGRLPACANAPICQEVPSDLQRGNSLSIQGPALRIVNIPLDLHPNSPGSQENATHPVHNHAYLSGRLVSPSDVILTGRDSSQLPTSTVSEAGSTR